MSADIIEDRSITSKPLETSYNLTALDAAVISLNAALNRLKNASNLSAVEPIEHAKTCILNYQSQIK